MKSISHEDWLQEAEKRYGKSLRQIRFICPVCKHVQSGQDFLDLGMTPEKAATRAGFSCIGRWMDSCRDAFTGEGSGPCNYTNGGLIRLGPIRVDNAEWNDGSIYVFDFADDPLDESEPVAAGGANEAV